MKTKNNSSESRFYSSLKDIFVGAKIEGVSGFINLMRIKSKYFDKIFELIKREVEEKLGDFPDFKEELYNKLWSFFKRYFSETGSLYFVSTPFSERIYERVYTDKEDVSLFWKTYMLYYIKTDRIFNSINIDSDGFKFFFDVSRLEHKKAWEKREIVYELKEVRKDGTISFYVLYSERGKKTKLEEIVKELKHKDIRLDEAVLEKVFRLFEKQSEVDYFINKNARKFLREQFDLWLYQYEFSDKSTFTEKRIKQLKALQEITYKIIDFISQFEDELVRIWNKPKFVLNSNYVVTLDRIARENTGIKLIEKISGHENFEQQVKEWKDLGIVDKGFTAKDFFTNTLKGKALNSKYNFLPIDTKYFKDLELEILSLFDNLDGALDGWLIKSENYQALNIILPKFKGEVQTIYIDPPFNKEQDADYFYNVKFKDATWITMLENRLRLARDVLKDTGGIFVRCDYNGNMYVRLLMNEIFGEENFRNEIVVNRFKKPSDTLATVTESFLFYVKDKNVKPLFNQVRRPRTCTFCKQPIEPRWHLMISSGEGKNPIIIKGRTFYPPRGQHWKYSQESVNKMLEEERIRINEDLSYTDIFGKKIKGGLEYLESEEQFIDSNWTDIPGYKYAAEFLTENAEEVIQRVIESTSNEGDVVLDFFLGSGTTTAVAHKLKRKWIGVEMGEHFWSVALPRMKKVLAYDKTAISKEKDVKERYNEKNAGGFFKYYELEQFEQTLRNVKYEDSDLFLAPGEDPYNEYIFMKDLKLLEALEIDYRENKVKVGLSKLYENIDIPETLSCLLGKRIRKIGKEDVEFEDGEKVDLKNLDYKLIKPLIWWEG